MACAPLLRVQWRTRHLLRCRSLAYTDSCADLLNVRNRSSAAHLAAYARYAARSAAAFAARAQPRCYARALVCDLFSDGMAGPHRHHRMLTQPWAAMQRVLAYHRVGDNRSGVRRARACANEADPALGDAASLCPLRVALVKRQGRRRLLNLPELLDECNAWRHGLVACSTIDLSEGVLAATALSAVDVLVCPHGADIINGLALHAGAAVVEVMPRSTQGCPCNKYRELFGTQDQVVHYQLAFSDRASPMGGTYNDDLHVPWEPGLRGVLEAAVQRTLA